MRWTLIIPLSLFGLAMGVGSLYGWTRGLESWLWLVIWLASALVLGWRLSEKPLLNGAATGGLMGLLHSFTQVLFFDIYRAYNPEVAQAETSVPPGYDARTFFVMLIPLIALFSALFLGLLAVAAFKIRYVIEEGRRNRDKG